MADGRVARSLRLPVALDQRLEQVSALRGVSRNQDIVDRLEASLGLRVKVRNETCEHGAKPSVRCDACNQGKE